MFEILRYSHDLDARLDHFVNEESVNGTFLQTRQFLNYHPESRFNDASFALHKGGTIVAYFPGAVNANGEFVSHPGSTFGGPVIARDFYTASRLTEILDFAGDYLSKNYKSVRLKITPAVFAKESPALLEFLMEHRGYTRHTELSAVTDLSPAVDPIALCDTGKRRQFKNFEKFSGQHAGVTYRNLQKEDLPQFYEYLKISKAKYHVLPVHSLGELENLAFERIPENIWLRGIFYNDSEGVQKLAAGAMFFVMPQVNAIHYQYIAPDPEFREFNPTVAILISIMHEAREKGLGKVSWGISTENGGDYLNESLFLFKESLGGKAALNVFYTKEF